jgi:20S proteasome alpha/beta subunit
MLLFVQENYQKDMSLKDAEVMALSTLKEVMEEKVILTRLM